jgi:hypothetical protein
MPTLFTTEDTARADARNPNRSEGLPRISRITWISRSRNLGPQTLTSVQSVESVVELLRGASSGVGIFAWRVRQSFNVPTKPCRRAALPGSSAGVALGAAVGTAVGVTVGLTDRRMQADHGLISRRFDLRYAPAGWGATRAPRGASRRVGLSNRWSDDSRRAAQRGGSRPG